MSQKKAKKLRQLHHMQQQESQYSFQHIENLIALLKLLTGEKPASITLTESYYNWFIQEAQRHAETLGLKPGFQNDQPIFAGVKIEKQTPKIAVTPTEPK